MSTRISRRDFLKAAGLVTLTSLGAGQLVDALSAAPTAGSQPNILMFLFDTVSAGNMSLYGYPRRTTPNLERLAERSVVYHRHYAAGNFTSPGTASLFTGAYPWSHRAIHMHGTMLDSFAHRSFFSLLPEDYYKFAYTHNLLVSSLLAQFADDMDAVMAARELSLFDPQYSDVLFQKDYNVSFWSEHIILHKLSTYPSSVFGSLGKSLVKYLRKRQLEKQYGAQYPKGLPNLNDIYFRLEDGIDWLIEHLKTLPQPYLCFVHFLPPHEPYTARQDFIGIFQDDYRPPRKPEHFFSDKHPQGFLNQERLAYDEFMAFADAEFGRLYDAFQQQGVLDNTTLIMTSDHGELFERGIRGHVTSTLYEPVIHVPLLISRPGQTQRQDVHTPTSCVDVLPTLLEWAGLAAPEWCEGRGLPGVTATPEESGRSVFAVEAKADAKFAPLTKATFALIKDNYKLIHYRGYPNPQFREAYELYDLAQDPEELNDLYAGRPEVAGELQQELTDRIAAANRPFQGA